VNLSRTPTGFAASWDCGIIIYVRRVRESHDTVYAEIEIQTDQKFFLTEGSINLSGPRIRQQWADDLEGMRPLGDGGNWRQMFEELSRAVIRAYRKGSPVQTAMGNLGVKPPEWMLEPIIRRYMCNAIMGDRDSGKSALAIACAVACQLPWQDNPFDFVPPVAPMKWLFLDWETSFEDFDWRLKCISAGTGQDPLPLHYRHCDKPLASDIDGVSEAVEKTGVDGLVIDSVGMASGGDLNSTESAFSFLGALRSLRDRADHPLTSLLVAHPSKDPNVKKKSLHGSAFFTNEARNVWELIAKPSTTLGEKLLILQHNKWNTTFYHPPRAILMNWDESQGIIRFSPTKPPADVESDKKPPLHTRAERVLTRGAKTLEMLAADMGITEEGERRSLATILGRHKDLFIKTDAGWWSLVDEF